jgi:putative transposase
MYPEACSYIGVERLLHSPLEKSITERSIEYFKYRTENFEEYYPCKTTYNVI